MSASAQGLRRPCPGLLQNTYFGETVWLFCVLLLLTMLGRAAFVFPFSVLHNWCSREQLSLKEMIVIWCAHLPTALTSAITPPPPPPLSSPL